MINYILTILLGCFVGAVIGCYFATINKRFEVLRNTINDLTVDCNSLSFEVESLKKYLDAVVGGTADD
jgi:hypothetical protein